MAFTVSNQAFAEAFGDNTDVKELDGSKKKGSVTEEFIKALTKYLKTQTNKSSVIMYQWLKKGGSLSAFACRGDLVEPLSVALQNSMIPFVLVQQTDGDMGFLIRPYDTLKTKKTISDLLSSKSHYCHVMSGEEAGKLYLRLRSPDKTMISVCGLNEAEIIYLEKLCDDVLAGEAIGIDKMGDGTYMVSCHGKSAVGGKSGKKKFTKALTETLVLMNGDLQEKMAHEADMTIQYREARANNFPDKNGGTEKPVWVVGSTNYYVKRASDGFELGHAEVSDSVMLLDDLFVPFNDPDYETRLNSALAKITKKELLYSMTDVIFHFRTKKNVWKDQQLAGEQFLITAADEMVEKKMRGEALANTKGKWDQKLLAYQREMGKLMKAVRDGRIPKGYTKTQILDLKNIIQKFKIDINQITPAINKMMELEVYERESGPAKIHDVVAKIDHYRGVDLGPEVRIDRGKEKVGLEL